MYVEYSPMSIFRGTTSVVTGALKRGIEEKIRYSRALTTMFIYVYASYA